MIKEFIKKLETKQSAKFTEQQKEAIEFAINSLCEEADNEISYLITKKQREKDIANDIIFFLQEDFEIDAEIDDNIMQQAVSYVTNALDDCDELNELNNSIIREAMKEILDTEHPFYDVNTGELFAICPWCGEMYSLSDFDGNYCHKCTLGIKSREGDDYES